MICNILSNLSLLTACFGAASMGTEVVDRSKDFPLPFTTQKPVQDLQKKQVLAVPGRLSESLPIKALAAMVFFGFTKIATYSQRGPSCSFFAKVLFQGPFIGYAIFSHFIKGGNTSTLDSILGKNSLVVLRESPSFFSMKSLAKPLILTGIVAGAIFAFASLKGKKDPELKKA